jgi:hypothetical protein
VDDTHQINIENLQVIRKRDHVRAFKDINDENIAYFQRALQNENWEAVYNEEKDRKSVV